MKIGNAEIRTNGTTLVPLLLRGSRNIDRMKRDVEDLVRMIIGLAMKCGGASRIDLRESFGSPKKFDSKQGCTWEVRGTIGHMDRSRNGIEVLCWVHVGDWGITSLGYSTTPGATPFHSETAQLVYEGLPTFVEGMIGKFPELEQKCESFVHAAAVFPEQQH